MVLLVIKCRCRCSQCFDLVFQLNGELDVRVLASFFSFAGYSDRTFFPFKRREMDSVNMFFLGLGLLFGGWTFLDDNNVHSNCSVQFGVSIFSWQNCGH